MSTLTFLETRTQEQVDACVIWLHGLGASGHDFYPIVPELKLAEGLGIHFIFPHAPTLPVTINGGMVIPAWYDIKAINIDRSVDTVQLKNSANEVCELIHEQIARGIASNRIFIAGFSQGGAVAYEAALSFPQALGGIIALSTYFATKDTIQFNAANRELPVFIGHGNFDNVVPESLGQQALATLKGKGYQPEYQTYAMAHSVCNQEILDIGRWLQQRLSSERSST